MSNSTEEEVVRDLVGRHWTRLATVPREMLHASAVVAWDETRAIITGGYDTQTNETKDSVTAYNMDTM